MLHVRKAIYLFCVYCTNLMSLPYFPLSAMTPGSSCLERLVSNFSSWLTCTNIAAAPLTIGHLLVYECCCWVLCTFCVFWSHVLDHKEVAVK